MHYLHGHGVSSKDIAEIFALVVIMNMVLHDDHQASDFEIPEATDT